jgi:type IV secretion system protein VirB6
VTCPALSAGGPSGIADALRAVDCMAGEATAGAFGRIFGGHGMLTAALTIGLTLYVALFAMALLTGRTSLNLAALTPRMIALGLALTFATSWIAYSQVIWTTLSAGPDWIASSILGIKGSAAQVFADRLDGLFHAVADAAEQARQANKEAKGTTPADLLSYAAVLLLLGTVGVLVTSRIALAALLAVGPMFLVFSLFGGTRGLFEGWVKAAVMFALVPLFTVLIGVGAVALLDPVVDGLAGGEIDMETAATVFVAAVVHCALMLMALRVVSVLTAGWHLPGGAMPATGGDRRAAPAVVQPAPAVAMMAPDSHRAGPAPVRDERVRAVVSAMSAGSGAAAWPAAVAATGARPAVPAPRIDMAAPMAALSTRARETGRGLVPPAKENLP